jgi:NAD+ synthase
MKYFLAQLNSIVGDIDGNFERIAQMYRDCANQLDEGEKGVVIFPEMAITGYPAEDILYKSAFRSASEESLESLKEITRESPLAMLVGGLRTESMKRKFTLANDNSSDEALFNSAFLLEGGELKFTTDKYALPNYGVFDEKRLFTAGELPKLYNFHGKRVAIMICEETWDPECRDHVAALMPDIIISQNASPFELDKAPRRFEMVSELAKQAGCPVIYVNNVGGQDELVFDGRSFACNQEGKVVHRLAHCAEEVSLFEEAAAPIPSDFSHADDECMYKVMVLGLKDYVEKNGFPGVVLGLSGGIDSGLTAAVAVDALGADKVRGVLMPSPYTSDDSNEDAIELAKNLGIEVDTVPIGSLMKEYDAAFSDIFKGMQPDTTEENIQSRIRGNILMALSNKLGSMVLTTGNKSELSVGYATLYGDMCGGYSVLKDCYKTTVFALSRWRNTIHEVQERGAVSPLDVALKGPHSPVIPERMITKPPTAELRPDQQDSDSLPTYDKLDSVLQLFIEARFSLEEVLERGYDPEMVRHILKLIYIAEYKRRQSPPGVRLSGMSFGRDRRYPITNQWVDQRV